MCEFRLFSVRLSRTLHQHSQSPSEGCNTESVLFVCFSLHGGKTQRGCDKVWLTKLPLGKVTHVATDLTRSVVARKSVSTFSTWQTACSLFCLFFRLYYWDPARVSDYLATNARPDKVYGCCLLPVEQQQQCDDTQMAGQLCLSQWHPDPDDMYWLNLGLLWNVFTETDLACSFLGFQRVDVGSIATRAPVGAHNVVKALLLWANV